MMRAPLGMFALLSRQVAPAPPTSPVAVSTATIEKVCCAKAFVMRAQRKIVVKDEKIRRLMMISL